MYVFKVVQGTRFYLKLDINTYPPPSWRDVELYRDGRHLPRSPNGTISLDGTSMGIPSVDKGYEGTYTIKATNGAEISFRLEVEGSLCMWLSNYLLFIFNFSLTKQPQAHTLKEPVGAVEVILGKRLKNTRTFFITII